MQPMWSDPKFNHCLQKEIDTLDEKNEKKDLIGSSAHVGTVGMKVELFLKLKEVKSFPEWKLYIFRTKDDKMVTMYGAIAKSPVSIDKVRINDCVKVAGTVASCKGWKHPQTRLNRVKILENKGTAEGVESIPQWVGSENNWNDTARSIEKDRNN